MNAIAPIAAAAPPDPPGDRALSLAARLDAEVEAMEARHLAQLEVLAGIGVALAEAVGRRVARLQAVEIEAGGESDAAGELNALGMSLNRVTRAVRLTMTLEARVRAARRARLLGLETERAQVAARAAEAEAKRVDARARLVCQAVEDTVKLDILRRNGEDASALDGEAIEYDEPEEDEIDEAIWAAERLLLKGKAYAGFADRPVSAVVAQVCADLGLTPDWSVWADEDWAIEEAEALPGSPFAGPAPLETGPRETGPP